MLGSQFRIQDGEDEVLSTPGPRDFPELSQKPWHSARLLLNGYPYFAGVKQPGSAVFHTRTSNAEVAK